MKRSRRNSSARAPKRNAYDEVAAQAQPSAEYSVGIPKDGIGELSDSYVPLSLRTDAGRQYSDQAFRLLMKIRMECDAAAERLGYASVQDNGIAAVEYIAKKILDLVRGERQQQTAGAKREPLDKSRLFELKETPTEVRLKVGRSEQKANDSERSKLIAELKQMLRDKKTKSGAFIDQHLAHEIAKYITILNEATAQPETKESIKQLRKRIAPFFAKLHGASPKTITKRNVASLGTKSTRSRKALPRTKKNVRKR